MDKLPSFQHAKTTYNHWLEERLKVNGDLVNIRDEIQRQCRIHSIGSITYSSVGLVGGGLTIAGIIAAPFTFGASLALTVAGVATGVTSGVAGVTHGAVKFGLIKKQFTLAKENLENHQRTCDDLKKSLMTLKQDLEVVINEMKGQFGSGVVHTKQLFALIRLVAGSSREWKRVLKLINALEKILPPTLKSVGSGASKVTSNALSVLVAIGIVIDLGTLISSAVDLAKIEKGQLSTEATKLQKVIDEMDTRLDVLDEFFQ